jgi:hypothetical protein
VLLSRVIATLNASTAERSSGLTLFYLRTPKDTADWLLSWVPSLNALGLGSATPTDTQATLTLAANLHATATRDDLLADPRTALDTARLLASRP